jgi:magnesium chelatase subunit D
MPQHFPFSAVVGADDMALALTLTTISPAVGGVLVRGEKGTAKSTIVRGLASVLPPIEVIAGDRFSSDPSEAHPLSPDGPFPAEAETETRPVRLVELPVGATEDRVLGSLHLEKALSEGITTYEPGLLARAHRGILYVDEVNLLHDHLVDLLLDAAAMGRSTVERDGVSIEHAARFVLVGTMNPEEGELRPQLLDRFGLTVDVRAPRDPETRAEIVRRRLAYEADPEAFAVRFAEAEADFTDRIVVAQKLVEQIELTDDVLTTIAELCAAFDVDGMRADIVTARAAAANAAWNGRTDVTKEDIRIAARLALPHRRRRNPFDAPGIDEQELDDLLGDDSDDDPDPDGDGSPDVPPPVPSGDSESDRESETDTGTPPTQGTAGQARASAGEPYRARLFTVTGVGAGEAGKRSRAVTTSGRRVGAERGTSGAIHLTETIRAAAPHQFARGRRSGKLDLRTDDLRIAVKEGHESNLVLFCVDASGSMAARKRMSQVKTAVLSLLLDAYQRRDKVGLITFRGAEAKLALPPTSSIDIAAARLDDLPTGGRTPLAEGLLQAVETLRIEHIRDPRRRPLLVVVTDGRATTGPGAVERAHAVAFHLADSGVASLVIDCESGGMRLGLARRLAEILGAEHVPVTDVSAEALTTAVRTHLPPRRDAEGAA